MRKPCKDSDPAIGPSYEVKTGLELRPLPPKAQKAPELNINHLSDALRAYNAWRRGIITEQPDPFYIGDLLESAASRLEVLERESHEFFENWHRERRHRELLERQQNAE